MNGFPKVSIAMITFNHEKCITEAIHSVLIQETDFRYELVIGEDCSTDHTRDIIQKIVEGQSEIIKPEYHPNNLGVVNNFVNTITRCKGKYIALLEGDDYWTDPLKLQKQVDFLESHPECVICFHQVMKKTDGEESEPELFVAKNQKEISTLEDILSRNYLPTCSVMFRNDLIKEFPKWYFQLLFGDWSLYVILAQHGNIGYINQLMGVYRIHQNGAWTSGDFVKWHLTAISGLISFDEYYGYRYKQIINKSISRVRKQIINYYLSNGQPDKARPFTIKGLLENPSSLDFWKLCLLSFFPFLSNLKLKLSQFLRHNFKKDEFT